MRLTYEKHPLKSFSFVVMRRLTILIKNTYNVTAVTSKQKKTNNIGAKAWGRDLMEFIVQVPFIDQVISAW